MQFFKIKINLVITLFLITGAAAPAQQLYKISNFMQHSFLTNPAAVGANGHATLGGVYRSQWSGIDGGPATAVIFGDTYFSKMNTGLGIVAYSDKTGPTSRTGGELNLSYSIKFDNNNNKRLMIGIGGQFVQFRVDKGKIADALPNDPLLAASGSTIKADANVGIYYRSNTLNMGISAKQLIQSRLDFVKTATNPEGRLYRHYSGTISYDFAIDEANVLQPNAQVRYQPEAPVDFEGGLILYHKDLIHLGGSYHYKQSYALFAGIKFMHRLSVNYAYEAYNTPISVFASGYSAHEIMLRYFFKK